ncbi:MAG: response regulator [Paenibacillus sp.]|nr:response regulator [Paenibacillus sp.]
MKVVLIDDEKAMHLIMKRMLAKLSEVEIVGVFKETAAAFAYLVNHDVDLVFVDISMPRETGLEFAARLRASGKPIKLVFVTSHKDYALLAFDVYAYDFIVKPVDQERLHRTVHRALAEKSAEQWVHTKGNLSNPQVKFNGLGGIDIQITQGVSVKWKSSKSAELFAYLLIHKGRFISRARLVEDIFNGMPQKNAETYLNTTVYQLRKVLELCGLKESLLSDNNHYALSLNQVSVDTLNFEEGCKELSVVEERTIEQAMELEQMYTGDLFGERGFSWAWSEVSRLSLMYTALVQRLCGALLDKGDTHTAIRLLKKLISRNELDEEPRMLLMRAFALQKNKEAIDQQYLQFKNTLHQEIGISPSLETISLYAQLISGLEL